MKLNDGRPSSPTSQRALISRATMLILACELVAMGIGAQVPPAAADLCLLFGYYGLAAYFALEVAARYRESRKARSLRKAAEKLIDRRIRDLRFKDLVGDNLPCAGRGGGIPDSGTTGAA